MFPACIHKKKVIIQHGKLKESENAQVPELKSKQDHLSAYWKWNFPFDPSCPSVGWFVGLMDCLSDSFKGWEVSLPCSYRNTCYFFKLSFHFLVRDWFENRWYLHILLHTILLLLHIRMLLTPTLEGYFITASSYARRTGRRRRGCRWTWGGWPGPRGTRSVRPQTGRSSGRRWSLRVRDTWRVHQPASEIS